MRRGAYSRRGAYLKFRVQERRLIEGGVYSREGAYSIKYGNHSLEFYAQTQK